MSDTIIIRAVTGRLVRHPHTLRPLPAEGFEVSADDPYWYRRMADGDVEPVPDKSAPTAPAPAQTAPGPGAPPKPIQAPDKSSAAAE